MAEENEKPTKKNQERQPQLPPSKPHQKAMSAIVHEKMGWFGHHFIEKIVARYKS